MESPPKTPRRGVVLAVLEMIGTAVITALFDRVNTKAAIVCSGLLGYNERKIRIENKARLTPFTVIMTTAGIAVALTAVVAVVLFFYVRSFLPNGMPFMVTGVSGIPRVISGPEPYKNIPNPDLAKMLLLEVTKISDDTSSVMHPASKA